MWGRAPSGACPERSRRVQAERKLGEEVSPAARRGFFLVHHHAEPSSEHDASSRSPALPLKCVIPNLGVLQPREGSCVDRIGAVPLHARSLVPLVKARDFGMTPVLEFRRRASVPVIPSEEDHSLCE
jgi:hypothetical protein